MMVNCITTIAGASVMCQSAYSEYGDDLHANVAIHLPANGVKYCKLLFDSSGKVTVSKRCRSKRAFAEYLTFLTVNAVAIREHIRSLLYNEG